MQIKFDPGLETENKDGLPVEIHSDSRILDLGVILAWLSNYFHLKPYEPDVHLLKRALRKLNNIHIEQEHQPVLPTTTDHELAINYVKRMPEGKILFTCDHFYILLTFFDFDIHVKKELIPKKIQKAKEHRHSARLLQFLETRFNLSNDYACLWSESDNLGKKAVDWLSHSKQLIPKIKSISQFSRKQIRNSHVHFECLNILRDAFLEIRF